MSASSTPLPPTEFRLVPPVLSAPRRPASARVTPPEWRRLELARSDSVPCSIPSPLRYEPEASSLSSPTNPPPSSPPSPRLSLPRSDPKAPSPSSSWPQQNHMHRRREKVSNNLFLIGSLLPPTLHRVNGLSVGGVSICYSTSVPSCYSTSVPSFWIYMIIWIPGWAQPNRLRY
jgi:hypothetical protein